MKDYFIWLLKVVTVAVVVLIVFGVLAAMKSGEGISSGENVVAVVEMKGQIFDTKDIIEELHKQTRKEAVKGVVLRIDSPGGTVGPSQEVFRTVETLKEKKPIVVSMGTLAASGGLYAALSASKIYAHPGTLTGSIGVISQLPEVSELTDKLGVSMRTVKSGELKDLGSPFKPMSDEERQLLQTTMDQIHNQFIVDVSEARNIPLAEVRTFADGRVLTGESAKELGLIDEFGGVHDAALAVFEILGEPLPEGEFPTLQYPLDKFAQFREFLAKGSRIMSLVSGERSSSRVQLLMP